jgi:arabinofuranosyltransferase
MTFTIHGPLRPMTTVERVGLAIALLLAAVLMWPVRQFLTDDTFIHLQYARNLAGGQGLVFNPGERVYGCISPLWAALIADGMALGFNGLRVARVLGFLATLWSVTLFLQLMRRNLQTPALCAAATVAWAGHAWMLRWSLSGLETPLAVALVLAGFVAFTEGQQWGARPVRTGALWALAALTRPEAALLLGLWGVFLLVDTDSRPGLRRLVFGALPPLFIYGAWLLFAWFYFGSVLPQALMAKGFGPAGLDVQLQNLWRQVKLVGATDGLMAALLGLALLAGGVRTWTRRPPTQRAQRLLPWVWLAMAPALYVLRGVPVHSRDLLPLLPVLSWLAWGAGESWSLGASAVPRTKRTVLLGTTLAVLVLVQNFTVFRGVVLPQGRMESVGLRASLIPWGVWLRENTPKRSVIATPEIGAVGYFSQHRVVDLAGLVTPQMAPYLEREVPADAIANFRFAAFARPEYLVDCGPRRDDLRQRSRYAPALALRDVASVLDAGPGRPTPYYSLYRVDWAVADSIGAPSRPNGGIR